MYSVVLMAAMTTGMDLPDRGGCRGGCYGGGGHGRRGGGCCGCYGGGYGGCMGMGYGGGCWGGGYGGCMGMGYGGGCMGMGYGGCMGMGYGGCMGCGGGMGTGGYGYGGGMMMQGTVQPGAEKIQKKPGEKKDEESMAPAPATILVQLPAEAKLRIDNEATTSTGDSRLFQTPVLNPGKEYHYTLTAEITRDGKPIKAEQVVKVKAGQTTPVTLTLPRIGVAQR